MKPVIDSGWEVGQETTSVDVGWWCEYLELSGSCSGGGGGGGGACPSMPCCISPFSDPGDQHH